MGNFRNKLKEKFSQIPNELIFDSTLSDRARFLYCYMASKPEDWDFYHDPMAKELGYSVDTLRKYLNELISKGWITRHKQTNAGGKWGSVIYELEDKKKNTVSEITVTEKNRIGKNRQQTNTDSLNNTDINNKKDISNDISKNKNFDDYEVVDDGMESKSQEKEAKEKSCAKKDKLKLIEEDFYNSLRPFVEEFGKDTVRAFFDYWTEPNKSNTKLKFQMEKTWDAKKRLIRWRDNNFGNNKSQSKYSAPPPKSRLETNMSAAAEAAELLKQIREKENNQ